MRETERHAVKRGRGERRNPSRYDSSKADGGLGGLFGVTGTEAGWEPGGDNEVREGV